MYDRGVGPTLTDDMGDRLDFGSLEDWDNPSIERRTNPVAKLFKAVWAWHFLTTIGLVFLILGAVNVVFSKDLEGVSTTPWLWLFYGVVLVFLGIRRKRRATSRDTSRRRTRQWLDQRSPNP